MPLTSVQTQYFDGPGALYPGQLADSGSAMLQTAVRSFITETLIYPGRFVVKGTVNAQTDNVLTPYKVKQVLAGSVIADVVGVAVRGHATDTTNDANNEAVTLRATTMNAVAELHSGAIIGADVPPGVTIAHNDPVYVSVSHVSIPVGKATNAAGTGLIGPIVGCAWYGAAAAGSVGRIRLNTATNV